MFAKEIYTLTFNTRNVWSCIIIWHLQMSSFKGRSRLSEGAVDTYKTMWQNKQLA